MTLKECPFCGEKAKLRMHQSEQYGTQYSVYCTCCGANPYVPDTKDNAVRRWNVRCVTTIVNNGTMNFSFD